MFLATDGGGAVEDGYAAFDEHLPYVVLAEGAVAAVDKALRIVVENEPHHLPHLVVAVGVEEIHAPAIARRWEAAQHQQACIGGHKGL